MPTVAIFDMAGKETGKIDLNETIFGIEPNKTVLHSAVVNYLANQRQGTQSTLTRAEVRGGGIKPWRQKGTGRARQGSIRAPQWRHGGIALGPKPRSYRYALPKKVRKLAMKSALSAKVLSEEILIVDEWKLNEIKTKEMVKVLTALGTEKKTLIVTVDNDDTVVRTARNIPGVKTTSVNTLNVYDILNCDKFIVCKDVVAKIEEVYA